MQIFIIIFLIELISNYSTSNLWSSDSLPSNGLCGPMLNRFWLHDGIIVMGKETQESVYG